MPLTGFRNQPAAIGTLLTRVTLSASPHARSFVRHPRGDRSGAGGGNTVRRAIPPGHAAAPGITLAPGVAFRPGITLTPRITLRPRVALGPRVAFAPRVALRPLETF